MTDQTSLFLWCLNRQRQLHLKGLIKRDTSSLIWSKLEGFLTSFLWETWMKWQEIKFWKFCRRRRNLLWSLKRLLFLGLEIHCLFSDRQAISRMEVATSPAFDFNCKNRLFLWMGFHSCQDIILWRCTSLGSIRCQFYVRLQCLLTSVKERKDWFHCFYFCPVKNKTDEKRGGRKIKVLWSICEEERKTERNRTRQREWLWQRKEEVEGDALESEKRFCRVKKNNDKRQNRIRLRHKRKP